MQAARSLLAIVTGSTAAAVRRAVPGFVVALVAACGGGDSPDAAGRDKGDDEARHGAAHGGSGAAGDDGEK